MYVRIGLGAASASPCSGRADVLTLDQVRKIAITYLGRVAGNEDPQDEWDRLRSLKIVAELCSAYIENH